MLVFKLSYFLFTTEQDVDMKNVLFWGRSFKRQIRQTYSPSSCKRKHILTRRDWQEKNHVGENFFKKLKFLIFYLHFLLKSAPILPTFTAKPWLFS